jgi:hypothetical protein
VKPPPALASGNSRPGPGSADIAIAGSSAQGAAATPDGQFVVNISAGAIAPHDADTSVHAAITPLDPGTLGPVPTGLVADGNAYRIGLTYRPSNTPLDALTGPGDVALIAPSPGHVLLYSSDGRAWTRLASQSVGATSTVISTFTHPGVYLVGANPTAVVSGRHSSRLGTAAVAALVAGLAIVLVAVSAVVRRRGSRYDGYDD